LRLSDAATFAFLAEHYNTQAEVCLQLARATVSPSKTAGWSLPQSGQSWRERQKRELR
jgi:hypothetical protein